MTHSAVLLFRRYEHDFDPLRGDVSRVPEILLPGPLPKTNPVIHNRRFLVRRFLTWRYSPDQDAEISVDVQGRPIAGLCSIDVFPGALSAAGRSLNQQVARRLSHRFGNPVGVRSSGCSLEGNTAF